MFDYNDSFCGKYIHINHQIFITWKKIKKGDVSLRGYNILIANQKKKYLGRLWSMLSMASCPT